MEKIEKLQEEHCLHRNLMHIGGLSGCPDCEAGEGTDWANAKIKPRKPDILVKKINEIAEKVNEIIDYLEGGVVINATGKGKIIKS